MTGPSIPEYPPTEIFSALSDPIRWSIIAQTAQVNELACLTLEKTLPVSKPTISYHVKILQNAGLISSRKQGRNYYYSLRRDVVHQLLDGLWELAPSPRPVSGPVSVPDPDFGPVPVSGSGPRPAAAVAGGSRGRKRPDPVPAAAVSRRHARFDEADEVEEVAVLTW